jgi:hypothetical protein
MTEKNLDSLPDCLDMYENAVDSESSGGNLTSAAADEKGVNGDGGAGFRGK